MPVMSTITLDLGQATFSENDAHVQIRTKVVIHVTTDDTCLIDTSQALHLLHGKDTWCPRRFPLKLMMGFSFGLTYSHTTAHYQQLQCGLVRLLQNAKIWRELGLKLIHYHRGNDESLPDTNRVVVHTDLVESTSHQFDAAPSPEISDLSNIQYPSSVVCYDLQAINIEWQFSDLKHRTGMAELGGLLMCDDGKIDIGAFGPSINSGLACVIGSTIPYKRAKTSLEDQSVIKLGDLAPSLFRHGFSRQLMERAKLMESVSRSLTKFLENHNDKQHKREPACTPPVCRMNLERIRQHLWMTATSAFTEMPLPRRPRPVPGDVVQSHPRPVALQVDCIDTAPNALNCNEAACTKKRDENGWDNLVDHHLSSVDKASRQSESNRPLSLASCHISKQEPALRNLIYQKGWAYHLPTGQKPLHPLNLDLSDGEMLLHTHVQATQHLTHVHDLPTILVGDDALDQMMSAHLSSPFALATPELCTVGIPNGYHSGIDNLMSEMEQIQCRQAWQGINNASTGCRTSEVFSRSVDRGLLPRDSCSLDTYELSISAQTDADASERPIYTNTGGIEEPTAVEAFVEPYQDDIDMEDLLIQ